MSEVEIPVSYEQLQALEDDFEEVELEMIRKQYTLTKDLYNRRQSVIANIPSFWPLVIEQSPPEIDEYIQPSDAALFMNSLKNISVDRLELPGGDPRSFSIRFEFAENEYFTDSVLEKRFLWRNAKDGWAGLVSEPVRINWKEGKDLTNGMLDLVRQVYDEETASASSKEETPNKKKLKEQMESTGLDGLSFFAWFGFRGPKISDEEHAAATKKEEANKQLRKAGKKVEEDDDEMEEDEDDDDEYEWEIFPTGDDLGIQFADELWPNAIRYFMAAQENELEGLSDIDFEDDDDDEDEDMEGTDQPNKKRKA